MVTAVHAPRVTCQPSTWEQMVLVQYRGALTRCLSYQKWKPFVAVSPSGSLARRSPGVRVRQAQLRHLVDVAALQEHAIGRTIISVDRRAKYLLVRLQPDRVLVLHLGMTGRLWVGPPTDQDAPHDHLIFSLGPEPELRHTRRFGMCFVTTEAALLQHPRLAHLGPEPLSEAFSGAYLLERARGLHKPVKNFVMDAAVVVGVGNIYASESLFLARLRPTRAVGRLRPQHWERLCTAIKEVLQALTTTARAFQTMWIAKDVRATFRINSWSMAGMGNHAARTATSSSVLCRLGAATTAQVASANPQYQYLVCLVQGLCGYCLCNS